MRNAAVALLAVPILAAIYVGALLRRSVVSRLALAFGLSAVLGIGVIGAGLPSVTSATPPSAPIVPLTRAAFRTVVATNASVSGPVTIEFSTPMNPASVAAAITVDPPTPVDLVWDGTADTLTISPRTAWAPGVFHSVSVQAGALAASGQPLTRPVRAAFLTRPPATATIEPTGATGQRVSVGSRFAITFVGPIDPGTVPGAIRLDPATPGTISATGAPKGPVRYLFTPLESLKADTAYELVVAGVRDQDGLELAPQSIAVRTVKAPGVVRFRPRADAQDAPRDAPISVRFTEVMDRQATARAFSVKIGGEAVKGTISWAESNKVLIFRPAAALPYGAAVVAKVEISARSRDGASMVRSVRAIFKTAPKPKAPTVTKSAPAVAGTGGGGGAVGGGSWSAVESYYLRLMNCTRTGGWIGDSGSCSSPGGRNVAELWIDRGISSAVSRPYARLLATQGACSHFIGGNPGNRLARAGFTSYRWAENIGCRFAGDPSSSVLGTHLFYQSEKPYSGGHYVNLMNPAYDRVGIGVWVSSGRVRLVIDFYHP